MKELNLVNFVVIEGKLLLFAYISWKKFWDVIHGGSNIVYRGKDTK